MEVARYVVLNPLRAGMIKDIRDWPWSSYPAMIGESARPVWLATKWLLAQFGPERQAASHAYIDFIRAGVGLPSVWGNLKNQIYLGSDRFIDRLKKFIACEARLDEIPKAQRRARAKPLQDYVADFIDSETSHG